VAMIHSVVIVVRSTEAILLSRFYGAVERASALLQAQWIQTVRDATQSRWDSAYENGGEQVAVCAGKYVVYSGTLDDGRLGDLLFFVAGTEEYDELALLEIVQALMACLRASLLANAPRGAFLNEIVITEQYHIACLVLDEMINQGVLEHTDPEVVRKYLKLKLKRDDLEKSLTPDV